jgi:Tol biopolymer transport system component
MTAKGRSSLLVGTVVALLAVLATPAQATFPGKNGRIAFIQNTGTNGSDAFTMNPDGSDVKQLTTFGAKGGQTCCASWSTDGKQLVFAADLSAITNFQLWAMNADGSNQHLLLKDPSFADSDPSFSPDGSQIVFTRCGFHCAIYRVQADGTELSAITNFNSNTAVFDFSPAYSPDGKTIAFTSRNRNDGFLCAIYLVNADGSNLRLLTSPDLTAFNPDWSPDGTKIALSTNNNLSTILDEELWLINADGSHPVPLTNTNRHWNGYHSGRHDYSGSWSPQGDKIVFECDAPDFSSFAVCVINPDGSAQQLVQQRSQTRAMEPSLASGMRGERLMTSRGFKRIERGGYTPRWGPASN